LAGGLLIFEVVRSLEDGRWHSFQEIMSEFCLSGAELREVLGFLARFEIVDSDEKVERVRLSSSLLALPV